MPREDAYPFVHLVLSHLCSYVEMAALSRYVPTFSEPETDALQNKWMES